MNLLGDIGLKSWVSMPIPVLGDNNAAISLAKNDILTAGNRFYTPDLHYNKEMHEQGLMCYRKVKSEDNISDSMPKMVTTQIHQRHVLMINGYEHQPPIPGPPQLEVHHRHPLRDVREWEGELIRILKSVVAGAGRSCMLIHEDCAAGEFPVQGWRYFGRTCRGQVSYLNRGHPGGMNPGAGNGNGIPIFSLRINKVESNNGNNN